MWNKILFWWNRNKFKLGGSYLGWLYLFENHGMDKYASNYIPFILLGLSVSIVLFAYGCIMIINTIITIKWKSIFLKLKSYLL